MNPTQIFKFARIWIYSENGKLIRLPLGQNRARPSCTVARGPRPQCRLGLWVQRAWPMATVLARPGAQRARPTTVRRTSARWSCHRAPGALRGAASGGATAAEVEQTTVLEHPQPRGYPPSMGVEAIAHQSSMSTGRGEKPDRRRRSPMRRGLRWPAAVLRRGGGRGS
jgi:hypothetical protein